MVILPKAKKEMKEKDSDKGHKEEASYNTLCGEVFGRKACNYKLVIKSCIFFAAETIKASGSALIEDSPNITYDLLPRGLSVITLEKLMLSFSS